MWTCKSKICKVIGMRIAKQYEWSSQNNRKEVCKVVGMKITKL